MISTFIPQSLLLLYQKSLPFFSEHLVAPVCEAQGVALVQALPPFIVEGLYFECVLTDKNVTEWDIGFALALSSYNNQLLKKHLPNVPWDACFGHCHPFSNLAIFVFNNKPGISISLTPDMYFKFGKQNEIFCSWINNMNLLLNGQNLCPETIETLSRIADLRKLLDLRIHNDCGFMLARSSKHIKIGIGCESIKMLADVLTQLGQLHVALNILSFLEKVSSIIDFYFSVHIDIEGTIKKISIECCPPTKKYLTKSQCDKFLSFLVSEGMIASEKKEGALSWIGGNFFNDDEEIPGENASSLAFMRNITHFKIIHTQGQNLQVKCYFNAKNCFLEK